MLVDSRNEVVSNAVVEVQDVSYAHEFSACQSVGFGSGLIPLLNHTFAVPSTASTQTQ